MPPYSDKMQLPSRSQRLLHLAHNKCNSFSLPGSSQAVCTPFFVGGRKVGLIRPDVWEHLKQYSDVFHAVMETDTEKPYEIHLSSSLQSFEDRTKAVDKVMRDLRSQNVLSTLKGWREEPYAVLEDYGQSPLMEVERSGACLLGVKQFGVHINGYVVDSKGETKVWIAQRSSTKQMWPGHYDNLVAGGLTSGMKVERCAIKECAEEASIPESLASKMKAAGCISYFFENDLGLFPECEFVMDLELPSDFIPVNDDGEVQGFTLMTIEEVSDFLLRDDFKPNSALIMLDFLIRHGYMGPDSEPVYSQLCSLMHMILP